MASSADIQAVKDNLPPDAEALGWNDVKITASLDATSSVPRSTRDFWQWRAAATQELVNINESGSSRSMEAIWDHAMKMLAYWDGRVSQEDSEAGVTNPKQSIAFHAATRV